MVRSRGVFLTTASCLSGVARTGVPCTFAAFALGLRAGALAIAAAESPESLDAALGLRLLGRLAAVIGAPVTGSFVDSVIGEE